MEENKNGGLLQSLLFSGGGGGGGGSGIFPVTTTITVAGDNSFSFSDANHTVNEISEAVAENKLPVVFATLVYGADPLLIVMYFAGFDGNGIKFEMLNANGNYIVIYNGNKVDGQLA